MAGKALEASAVVFLLFASFVALSSLGIAAAPAQYHAPAEIYPQGSGSGLDADTLDAKHASAFITSETDPTVAASVKDGVSWGEVSGRPSYSCGAANQGLKTIDLNTGAVSCETDDIGGGISGSGSANYVAKWASGTSLGNSIIYDNGNVGVGTASPGQKLTVAGTIESTSGGIKFPDGSVQTSSGLPTSAIWAEVASASAGGGCSGYGTWSNTPCGYTVASKGGNVGRFGAGGGGCYGGPGRLLVNGVVVSTGGGRVNIPLAAGASVSVQVMCTSTGCSTSQSASCQLGLWDY